MKRNKRNPDQTKRSKILFTDDMILYIENPKETIRKLLQLISEFIMGYKVNTRSLAFLYTNNEKSEREIKETVSMETTYQLDNQTSGWKSPRAHT